MFSLRRKKDTSNLTVRADELLVGDRLVYNSMIAEVLSTRQHSKINAVVLGYSPSESDLLGRRVEFFNNMQLITVDRPQ